MPEPAVAGLQDMPEGPVASTPAAPGSGGQALTSPVDREISGYTWDASEFVLPRDDGVFRFDLPILMYHSISRPGRVLCVTPEDLRSQMEALRSAGYTGVTLETALLYARGIPVRMPPKPVVLTFDDGYKDFTDEAMAILEEFGYRATVMVIAGFVGKPGYMSWDDVRAAAEAGHEIGCHSMSHPDLRDLDQGSLERQVRDARDYIESNAGIRPVSFCYPSGKHNGEVRSMVIKEGYLGAVTTSPGWASTTDDLYLLSRIRVDGSAGIDTFKAQMRIDRPD